MQFDEIRKRAIAFRDSAPRYRQVLYKVGAVPREVGQEEYDELNRLSDILGDFNAICNTKTILELVERIERLARATNELVDALEKAKPELPRPLMIRAQEMATKAVSELK